MELIHFIEWISYKPIKLLLAFPLLGMENMAEFIWNSMMSNFICQVKLQVTEKGITRKSQEIYPLNRKSYLYGILEFGTHGYEIPNNIRSIIFAWYSPGLDEVSKYLRILMLFFRLSQTLHTVNTF